MRCLFVLHPEITGVEPRSVIPASAPADDHWNFAWFPALATAHFEVPTAIPAQARLRRVDKQMQRPNPIVGKKEIIEAIAIDIDKAQAIVAPLLVHNRCAGGQREGSFLPS